MLILYNNFTYKIATSSPTSPLNFGSENEVVLPMAVYEKLNTNVILISKNPVIREQAFLLEITAEPFKDELAPSLKEQYTGKGGTIYTDLITYVDFTMELNECIPIDALLEPPKVEPLENMFFKLTTCEDPKYVIVRYTKGTFVPLIYLKKYCPEGYKPLNDDQKMMMK